MAYTDFTFYENTYHGNVVPADDFERIADRASDFLDVITFDRLADGLPDDERAKTKVQKAVCAVAEKLYELELAEKQANAAALAGASSDTSGGARSGVIVSRSAGSESISYASLSDMASGAKNWSAVYQEAGNPQETNKILESAARLYLMGVRDDKGVLLMYAGL
nr:MAG TPA: Head Tail Connector Protein [Caudoviricetes sp.]